MGYIFYQEHQLEEKPISLEAQKNGGIVKRKTLQDLSNSAKPSEIPSSWKKISKNVSKGQEKSQVGGSKAINDITNSVNRPSMKKIQDDKKQKKELIAVVEEENFPVDIVWDGFLHDHQECEKAWTMDEAMIAKSFLQPIESDGEGKILAEHFFLKISLKFY